MDKSGIPERCSGSVKKITFIILVISTLINFGITKVLSSELSDITNASTVFSPLIIPTLQNPIKFIYSTNGLSPVINSATVGVIQYQGRNATFNISVLSTNTPRYQWYNPSGNLIASAIKSSYTITNIQPSNKGLYYISVMNNYGSLIISSTLTVLSTNILPQCLSNNTVILAWDYDFTNNPTVNGFKIYDGIATKIYTNIVEINGKVTIGQITNLLSGTAYYFSATAKDTNNLESDYSNEIFYNIPTNTLKQFIPDVNMLVTGIPKIQIKVCPFQVVTILYSTNLISWLPMKTITADMYGNILWDDQDPKRGPFKFYRGQTQ